MSEIRLITKEDFPNLKYRKLDWDVEVKGIPYQVIRVEGFAHCIGGHLDWGDGNNFWAYPLSTEMSYETLVEFNGEPGACWGLEYATVNNRRTKWDETEISKGRKLIITRNGKPFYDGLITFHQAVAYIKDNVLNEHPLDLNVRDFDQKCIGRKVWWRSQPAVITDYINGQACVILKPDGIDMFEIPKEFEKSDLPYDENREEIKTTIFDDHIWWFRE